MRVFVHAQPFQPLLNTQGAAAAIYPRDAMTPLVRRFIRVYTHDGRRASSSLHRHRRRHREVSLLFSRSHTRFVVYLRHCVYVCVCTIMKYRVSIRIEDKNAFRGHKTTGVDIEIFEEEKKWSVTFDKGPRKGNVVSGEISGPRLLHILFIIRIALFFFLFFLFYLLTS